MLEPWNDASILPPPILTSQPIGYVDPEDIAYICLEMSRILSSQTPLHKEGAILSRLLYKFDKKFRNDIGYRSFKKVNSALRRYLSLNLLKTVETFGSVLPRAGAQETDSLPTRQMLEHLLVRLITFTKVMERICVCSRRAAVLYLDRVRRGEAHWMSLMPFAVVSRTASISSVLLTNACIWYDRLHAFLNKLQPKGVQFLPENYKLPENLSKWLALDELNELGRFNWKTDKCLHIGKIADCFQESDQFDILKYISDINERAEEDNDTTTESLSLLKKETSHPAGNTLQNTDQGQVVSRDTLKVKEPEGQYLPKLFKQKIENHNINCVTNTHKLKQFLANEEKYRNEGSEAALSKHLSFMQWQALKNTLHKLTNSLLKPTQLQKKFQKIWKDKCLDYC